MNIRGILYVVAVRVLVFTNMLKRKLDGTDAKINAARAAGKDEEVVKLVLADIDIGVLGNFALTATAISKICEAMGRTTEKSLLWVIICHLVRNEVVPKEYQWVIDDYHHKLPVGSDRLAIGHWVLQTMIALGEIKQHQSDFYLGTGEKLDRFLTAPPTEETNHDTP